MARDKHASTWDMQGMGTMLENKSSGETLVLPYGRVWRMENELLAWDPARRFLNVVDR